MPVAGEHPGRLQGLHRPLQQIPADLGPGDRLRLKVRPFTLQLHRCANIMGEQDVDRPAMSVSTSANWTSSMTGHQLKFRFRHW